MNILIFHINSLTILTGPYTDGKQEYCTSKKYLKANQHFANFDGKVRY